MLILILYFGKVKKGESPTKMFVILYKGGGVVSGNIIPLHLWIILS